MSIAGVKKGPDTNGRTIFTLEQRSGQLGTAPICGCGCGERTKWDAGRCRWRPYASRSCYHGTRRNRRPYTDMEWLIEHYVTQGKSTQTIADECGVSQEIIRRALQERGIPRRGKGNPGAKNPAWKGGIAKWAYSPDWKAISRNVRERDAYTCQLCGEQRKRWGKALHVHHIDRDKFNNDLENLISLCATCHPKVEYAS